MTMNNWRKYAFHVLCVCAAAVAFTACDKDADKGPEEPLVSKISYRARTMDVTVTPSTTQLDIPFTVIASSGTVYAGKGAVGTVDYDRTTAVRELHYAFSETEPATRINDSIYTFPIRIFPERIGKPVTLTLCGDFPHFYPATLPFIDTLTIHLNPAQ